MTELFSRCIRSMIILGLLLPVFSCKKNSTEPAAAGDDYKISFVSFRDGNFEIYLMNADGTDHVRLTNDPDGDAYPEWSPDGTRIIYVKNPGGSPRLICVMDADGSNQAILADSVGDDYNERPVWSIGGKIAYQGTRTYSFPPYGDTIISGIFIMLPDGSNRQLVAQGTSPVWSKDGTKIAYLGSSLVTPDQLFVMDADGSNQLQISKEDVSNIRHMNWSPDGSRIAFALSRATAFDIFVVNADGSGLKQITDDPGNDEWPVWHPDGTKLCFLSDRNGSVEVYTMDPEGKNVQQLSKDANSGSGDYFRDFSPSWSPDGTRILFISHNAGIAGISLIDENGKSKKLATGTYEAYPAWSPVRFP